MRAGRGPSNPKEVPKQMSTCLLTDVSYDFVQDAVRQQAQLRPAEPALVDEAGRSLTYGELNRRSAQLAQRLRGLGVRPDDRVAVWMDRSFELIVSLLAVLEAGAAYVPVDNSYPAERVAFMLENSGARVCITDRDVPREIADRGLTVVNPAHDPSALAVDDVPPPCLGPENLAYVIYTSGSTGSPKGVAMSHRGLTRLIRWQVGDGPPGLCTLQFTPICFDVTFQEVFSTLCTGGALVLVPDALRRDPERLLATLDERSVERLFLPYVALQQLALAATRIGFVPRTLRHVITAGERLIVTEAIRDLFAALPECRLDNQYGPTETHLVTRWTLGRDVEGWPSLPPIGEPAAGVTLHNLDAQLAPVPAGEPGELYVSGDGLARGYLNAPALTAERFISNPFGSEAGARMYKTGDVVRLLGDGAAVFVGRSDDQIKVRGYRIEPGEVELVLAGYPGVAQAAVGLRALAGGVSPLVGYVVTDGSAVTASDLSKYMRARLPDYMVPSRFFFLDALPLTRTGKTDRRLLSEVELPAPAGESPARGESLAAIVSDIWERVLGHNEFEPDDDFFDVGGDSLLATWVVAELSQALGREIDLSLLLQDSTLKGLADNLEVLALPLTGERPPSEVITLRAGPSQRVLFLVHPLGGELLAYKALARSIKAPLRVLGLRWQPGEVAAGERPVSLREMAAVHLAQVRAVQSSGPYLLAGWSFGGVLAFELAQQLVAAGERVDFLGLFDANPVLDSTTGVLTKDGTLFERLSEVLAEIDGRLAAGGADADVAHLLTDPRISGLLGNTVPEGVTAMHVRKNLHLTRDNVRAAMDYRAAPYGGAIDLFQPADVPPTLQESQAAALRQLAQGAFRTHTIPGDHYSILRAPLVETMARAVDDALEAITRH